MIDCLEWPHKHDVLGVRISATCYEQATRTILAAARSRTPAIVSLHAVHAVVTASGDPALRDAVNSFAMVAPDGQPVRWALNWLYRARLTDRVYGPELMLRLCERASREGISIYLYGGASPDILQRLEARLCERFPMLRIAGSESPPFRGLTAEEDREVVDRINGSGAGVVFIGLGCPKQDWFAYEHRDRIQAVQVCVGAAFDFHSGTKQMAPRWMQQRGLEWLYRLGQEPRRLARRYLVTNSLFLARLTLQAAGCWVRFPAWLRTGNRESKTLRQTS